MRIYFLMVLITSAWGEGLFLAIQTAIIAALVLLYGTKSIKGKLALLRMLIY